MPRHFLAIALLMMIWFPPPAQATEHRMGEWGACSPSWTSQDIGRGPSGVVNGVSLPFRALYGSLADSWETRLLSPLAVIVGSFEGVAQVGAGIFDLLSLGYFQLGPSSTLDGSAPVLVPMRVERFQRPVRPEECPA